MGHGSDSEDENLLRLRALETQVKNLIPEYGSPPRMRSESDDSGNVPSTSRRGHDGDDDDGKRDETHSPSPLAKKPVESSDDERYEPEKRRRRRKSSRSS